jgi:pentapeptide MXKDX repeat protein
MKVCPACNATYDDDMVFCPRDGGKLLDSGSSDSNSRIGQVLDGRYRIEKLLGEGGMGEVYLATHIYIEKKVAIKLLRAEITSSSEAVKRFHQEARSSSSIGHKNIIKIEDFGKTEDGLLYLAMEFLDGDALSDIMLEGPMENSRALGIMIQTCSGLAVAHAKGIVHRDMKPENVIIVRDEDDKEVVKILDFGIAKMTSGDGEGNGLTKTGTIFGTPHYMSPEQAMGRNLDHHSDIYSIGVMMFELFTGSVPFKAESFMGILTQHITEERPKPTGLKTEIPQLIEDCILKSMALKPEDRFDSMDDFIKELVRIGKELGLETPAAPPPRAAAPVAPAVQTPPAPMTGTNPPLAATMAPAGMMGPGTYPPNTGAAPMAPAGTFPPGTQAPGSYPPGTQAPGSYPPGVAAPAGTFPPQSTGYMTPGFSQTQSPIAGQSTTMQAKSSSTGLIIFLIILLLGGAGGAGYWYFMIHKKSDDTKKDEIASTTNKDGDKDNSTDSMKPDTDVGSMNADAMNADTMNADAMNADAMNADAMNADTMNADTMNADTMIPDAMVPDKNKLKDPVKIMLFTSIDSFTPPPVIKIDGVDHQSPYTIEIEKDSTVIIKVVRNGYRTVTKVISGKGKTRVNIKMRRKRRSNSVRTMRMQSMQMRTMQMSMPASWLD